MKLRLLILIFSLIYIRDGDTAGACHYFSDEKLDWFEALFACQRKKLCLANFDTKSAYSELEKKLPSKLRDEYWIGANSYEKNALKYVASDKPLEYIPPDTKIFVDKPCAYIKPLDALRYTFSTGTCGRLRRYVCVSAVRCNGLKTNSTFVPSYNKEPPCEINNNIRKLLRIPLKP